MAASRDYYKILGINRTSSDAQIKRAYHQLARQHHPDLNRDPGAEERFKEINEAYEVLSDRRKRAEYDRWGRVGPGRGFATDFRGFGLGDIFEDLFGFGGMRTAARRAPQRGADLRYDLTLTFEEAAFGCEKKIEVARLDICPVCRGAGAEPGTEPIRCPQCNGTGEVRRVRQSVFGSFVNVTTCGRCGGEGEVVSTPCSECRGQKRVRVTKNGKIKLQRAFGRHLRSHKPGSVVRKYRRPKYAQGPEARRLRRLLRLKVPLPVQARPAVEPRQGAGMTAYAASKAAVAALTEALAEEVAADGIWVNAVAPSIIDTPANRAATPDADFSRWPSVGDVATALVFLASPSNGSTRGSIVKVYGKAG